MSYYLSVDLVYWNFKEAIMAKQRFIRRQQVKVEECERCNNMHEFPIEIIFDREVYAFGLEHIRSERHEVALTCPVTQQNIIISVPMSFNSVESFIQLR